MTATVRPKQRIAAKKCIFCQLPKRMSKEHIWGDWLKAYIPPRMNKHTMQSVRINRPNEPATGNIFLKAGDPLRSKVQVVCVDCNNQWLSDIQNRAKPFLIPLIRGERTGLGSEAQQRTAAWCAMAAMTAEFIDRDPKTIAVPQSQWDWLMNNGTAPPGWRIWLADYHRRNWPAQWVHLTLPIFEAKEIPKNNGTDYVLPNTQTTTFVVGRLYVHVMSSADPENIDKWATTFTRAIPLLVPFMPSKESFVAWPPARSLTDREADTIASAFHLYVESISRSLLGRRLF